MTKAVGICIYVTLHCIYSDGEKRIKHSHGEMVEKSKRKMMKLELTSCECSTSGDIELLVPPKPPHILVESLLSLQIELFLPIQPSLRTPFNITHITATDPSTAKTGPELNILKLNFSLLLQSHLLAGPIVRPCLHFNLSI
jgi:hypothetical protein